MSEEAAKQLFDLVRDLKTELAKLNATLAFLQERNAKLEGDVEDLKLKDAKRTGVITAAAAIGGLVSPVVMWVLKHLFGGAQ